MPSPGPSRPRIVLRALLALIVVALVAFMIGVAAPLDEFSPVAVSEPVVIKNVRIIDVERGVASPPQTVVIDVGRIAYIGAAASSPTPAGARVIDGAGKYLIPGLWDSHVHTLSLSPQLHFPLLIANGVTSVRDMGDQCSWSDDLECVPDRARWQAAVQSGALLAPRIVATASYHVESVGGEEASADGLAAASDSLTAALKARGDDFIKLQLDDAEAFQAMMRSAQARDLRVAGHLPHSVDLLDPKLDALYSVEHDTGLTPQCSAGRASFDGRDRSKPALLAQMDETRCSAVLARLVERAAAYTPTHVASSGQDWLILDEKFGRDERLDYIPAPQRLLWRLIAALTRSGTEAEDRTAVHDFYRAALKLTHQAHRSGVRVLAGSDALDPYVVHGFALHEELTQFVTAGLTPAEALRTATLTPAVHFAAAHESGSIAVGKLADLVLLNANPLEDIRRTRNIDAVIARGAVYDRQALDAMMDYARAQARSFRVACRFIWDAIAG